MSNDYINYNEVSISNLQKAEDMNINDYFIIQPQDFNNQPTILPYKNLILGLDNVSFANTITQHSSDIISLSSDTSTISSNTSTISSDVVTISSDVSTISSDVLQLQLPVGTILLLRMGTTPTETDKWKRFENAIIVNNNMETITAYYWMKIQ